MATFDDWKKIELRVGKILEAERVDGSDKLLKMKVAFGAQPAIEKPTTEASPTESAPAEPIRITRQILAGIGKNYEPVDLIGKSAVFIVNLEPRMIMGLESQGMILAASGARGELVESTGPVILIPDKQVDPGAAIS